MAIVIGVRFKKPGKVYYFDPCGLDVKADDPVVVETVRGVEMGECARAPYEVPDEEIVPPLRKVVRIATDEDISQVEQNRENERRAYDICQEKIAQHKLEMKLVDVEYAFDCSKIIFYFTANGRVDFRMLVKDLAAVFKTRIELRQIGVRDEAKMLGGIGICGRPFCCSQFLDDFQPVSTKMAKIQSMSLNPSKISGTCGRLMCCLRYEEEAYEDLVKTVPKNGAFVETPAGYGNVTQVNLLRRTVKVKLDGEGEDVFKTYSADEVAAIPGGRPKPGEPLPQLLKNRPAPERAEEEPEAAAEAKPRFYPVEAAESEPTARKPASEVPVRKRQGGRGRGKRQDAKPSPDKEPREHRESKEPREPKEQREPRPRREQNRAQAPREPKEPKEGAKERGEGQSRRPSNRRRRPQGGKPKQPKQGEE